MRHLFRWAAFFLAGFLLCCCVGVVVFDALVVRPALSKIESTIASGAPSEREPPSAVVDMVHRAYGSHLKYLVARDALAASPSQVDGLSHLSRQFTELGLGLLLPLHLSEPQVATAYLSWAYMGPGVRGFAVASDRYLKVPLENLTPAQAARLVAIAHAPSAYLASPERLDRRTRYLLSLQPQ